MSELKPLSEQIEQRVRVATTAKVNNALAQARQTATQAYLEAFAPLCGPTFGTPINDALAAAEAAIAEAAQKQIEKTELEIVLSRILEPAA